MSAVGFLLLLLCLLLSPPSTTSSPSADALLLFKSSLNTSIAALDSWTQDSDPCGDRWAGVFCHNDTVIRLHLTGMGLSGESIDIGALKPITTLITISLTNNSFSGNIPPFNTLPGLKALYLSGNAFSGNISNDYFVNMTLRRVFLSFNKFEGTIPESLGTMHSLQQLHLENNEFSGTMPDISQKSINELDFSNNKLSGEVPENMTRFGADAFKGNAGVCGKLMGVECPLTNKPVVPNNVPRDNGNNKTAVGVMVGILAVMLVLFVLTTAMKSRHDDDDFDVLGKERMDDVVEVRVHGNSNVGSSRGFGGGDGGLAKRSLDSSYRRKDENSTRRGVQGGAGGKAGMGDLVVINNEKGVFGLADLMKAAAEVLGNGSVGSAYKAIMSSGVSVVVKRIRDMNKLRKDEFDAELRKIGGIRHPNILTPLAYHYRKEEKLVVSEYIPKGSLLYVLHGDRGICHAELNWPTRLKIIKGIASGMSHLHSVFASCELPHGNLKSSNVLLNDNYEPLLSDYAFLPLVTPSQASQGMFSFKAPEAAAAASPEGQHQAISKQTDVYCLGIIILEILTGKFPSQYLNTGKGGTDVVQWVRTAIKDQNEAEFIDPEIASTTKSIGEMVRLLHIGAACTESSPDQRPTTEAAVKRIQEIKA
ncbi:Pollen receptor-like kinase 3-like protein [Drosera capensis]